MQPVMAKLRSTCYLECYHSFTHRAYTRSEAFIQASRTYLHDVSFKHWAPSHPRAFQAKFKKEYNTPGSNWDKLSVKWTDAEDQALRKAVKVARCGVGFIAVK